MRHIALKTEQSQQLQAGRSPCVFAKPGTTALMHSKGHASEPAAPKGTADRKHIGHKDAVLAPMTYLE